MKASDIFVKILEKHWVKTIYWVPWEENLDFLNSLKDSKIEFIVTRNEQTAVFMAATHGRLTWKIWVALATLWPWATNMLTWVAYAHLWWMPVMLITWQKPIKFSKQWQFQILDVVGMMKPVTKFAKTIISARNLQYSVISAIKIAEEERPWAVHIELPEDIAWEDVDITEDEIYNVHYSRRAEIDEKMLKKLVEILENSKSPVILVWAWANRKRISKYLTEFIKKYNFPYFTSQMWKWVVSWQTDNYLWTAALTSWDYIHDVLEEADLIVSVWYDTVEKPVSIIKKSKTKLIHIDFTPSTIDLVYHPDIEVIWDIWNTFWRLCEIDIDVSKWDFNKIYEKSNIAKQKIIDNISLEDWNDVMMPRKLVKDLRDALDVDDILTLDNWLYKLWIARNYPAKKPNTILLDNALATMWAWLASAMEAKRLNPDKKVVCVTWDWWFVMNLWDLETAVRLWIDLVVIILNNNNYWMIRWKQESAWFDNFWLWFKNPDFVKLAESFWAKWYRVKNKNDFVPTLKQSLNSKWINLIDLDFEYPADWKII